MMISETADVSQKSFVPSTPPVPAGLRLLFAGNLCTPVCSLQVMGHRPSTGHRPPLAEPIIVLLSTYNSL